ncbi:MAG: homocysteine S-methyltransferase family protein [Oscillospiraceae bacterium]|nr:homocysteine S-methyltransferase family protein [Oscillospiraceae bacterium]
MNIREHIKNQILILDGGMGTMLYKSGKLNRGENPVLLNLQSPETVKSVHMAYLQAGADMILTNTFAVAGEPNFEEIIKSAVGIAKEAVEEFRQTAEPRGAMFADVETREKCRFACFDACVALNVGPIGEMLEPLGELRAEAAYEKFKLQVLAGVSASADAIYIETMTDLAEAEIAVRAARENCNLPIFATMSFEENLRTFMGVDIPSMAETLERAGADFIGINCSVGPVQMLTMAAELKKHTSLPIIIKPNAGLPTIVNGEAVYDVTPEEFAANMRKIIDDVGVSVVGGCCGTTPEFIEELAKI